MVGASYGQTDIGVRIAISKQKKKMQGEKIMNCDYDKPCCYFYIDDKQKLAYVGKANGTIRERIKAHEKESKFIKCNCEFDIRYQVFESSSDMDCAEIVYIKSLKPYLNVASISSGFFPEIVFDVNILPRYISESKTEKLECNDPLKGDERKKRIADAEEYFKHNVIPYLELVPNYKEYHQYYYIKHLDFSELCERELTPIFYDLFHPELLHNITIDIRRMFDGMFLFPVIKTLERHNAVEIVTMTDKEMEYRVLDSLDYHKIARYFITELILCINDSDPPYSWFDGIDILISAFNGNYEKIEKVWNKTQDLFSDYTEDEKWLRDAIRLTKPMTVEEFIRTGVSIYNGKESKGNHTI